MLNAAQRAYRCFLRSEFWKNLSAQAKALNPKCQRCGDVMGLEAHHKTYPKDWYQTTLEMLEVLCRSCHQKEHGVRNVYGFDRFELEVRSFDRQMRGLTRESPLPGWDSLAKLAEAARYAEDGVEATKVISQRIVMRASFRIRNEKMWVMWLNHPNRRQIVGKLYDWSWVKATELLKGHYVGQALGEHV